MKLKPAGRHEGPSSPKPDHKPAGQRKAYPMAMHIISTPMLTNFAGVPVRVWKGRLPDGEPCEVFVHRIVVHSAQATAQLQQLIPLAVPLPLHQVFDELEAGGKECEPYGAI